MREIEFRAKGLFKDTWYYGYYMEHKRSMRFFIVDLDEEVMATEHLVDKNTLGQYTGLTDKNGKKIFEGDIVKATPYGRVEIGFVRYELNAFRIVHYVNGELLPLTYTESDPLMFSDKEVEVIGNIYDNPELLEGDNA